ncbi:MAG: PAS domain S-box protein [Porticoccaceae bacterium]|nr:PAS domain S-box protein [Porticoccaceae bacterium]
MNDNDSQGRPDARHLLDNLADIQGRLRRQLADPGLDGGLRADILAALGGPSAAVLDALPAHVTLLDHRGVIVQVNAAWRRFADHNDGQLSCCGRGADYLAECDRASAEGSREAAEAGEGIRAVLAGRLGHFEMEYPCHGPNQRRWFTMRVSPLVTADGTGALVMHMDASARMLAEQQAERNARYLAAIVDFERQLIHVEQGVDDLLARVPAIAERLLDGDGAAMFSLKGDEFACCAASGIAAAMVGRRLSLDLSLCGKAARTRAVQLSLDAGRDQRVSREVFESIHASSLLAAPIVIGDQVVGVIKVMARERNRFGEADVSTLELMASSLANILLREYNADRLRASEQQYRLLFDNNPQPLWVYDLETLAFLAVNDAAIEHYGYSREEFLGMTIADIRPAEDVPRLLANIAEVEDGVDDAGVWRHRKKDGTLIEVEIVSHAMALDGRPAEMVMATDVSARRQAERDLHRVHRAQQMLSQCNGVLVRASDEATLLRDITAIAIGTGGYHSAWVGYAEDGPDKPIRVAIHSAADDSQVFLRDMPLSWDENRPEGQGMSGRTIREGVAQVCEDLAQAPGSPAGVSRAATLGVRSLLSLPLRNRERTFGVLALYSAIPGEFPAEEISLCQELADNLAFGIEHLREIQERAQLEAAVFKVASSVSTATGPAFFQELTASIADTLGADACVISRLLPGGEGELRTLAGIYRGNPLPPLEYRLGGTPCEHLVDHPEWVIPSRVRDLYPDYPALARMNAEAYVGLRLEDNAGQLIGVIFVAYCQALGNRDFVVSVLRIFAARAMAELARMDADTHIREQASLLDKARDAILVRDLDYRISYWNKGAEALYGWRADEVLGNLYGAGIEGEARRELEAANARVLAQGEWRGQLHQKRNDGRAITVEAHWTLVRDDAGEPRSVLCIHSDISERLALEEQLRQSQRLESLGQLTGGVAHDFNNLLTVILGNAELLAEELADDRRLGKLAEMIRNASERGADLTQRLLAVARRQALEPSDVAMGELLADMGGLLRRTLHENIEIDLRVAPDTWKAIADPGQLEGAVLNLCINARDAMPAGGLLTLETANRVLDADYCARHGDLAPGPYVMIAVSDTGVGVPAENLARIFDPFFTTKEKGKGTGLGLSMVYGFVKQSRGHVSVYSEVGVGTTVKIYLPRAGGPGSVAVEAEPRAIPRVDPAEISILLVEDDEMVRAFASQMLLASGYRVLVADNGPAALEVLRSDARVDLLFTDVIMPGGLNGPQLAEQALALRPGLRVLFTSGYTENAIARQGQLDSGIPLLNKPYRQGELMAKIHLALGRDRH